MRRAAAAHAIAIAAALLGLAAQPAVAQGKPGAPAGPGGYGQRYAALCAACHGANGRSDMPGTPALAGQHSFYAITQLFLFREGRRANEAMSAVAKTMNDTDLRGFSDFIATLPPVPAPPPATPPDAARMLRGQALAQEHRCLNCHGADLSGGQQVPRIAQQREDYLQLTLREFSSGKRPGYTQAMGAALSGIPVADLDSLAYYIARLPGAAPSTPPKPSGK
ncbi:c-type cytochrome [Variovorax saccharolyticus]|uniref:c-type cytochrome n=1 Tax=Variovorax saccharolyticus TaxID=3053516 RepID=UPI002575DC5B|nr:c-type cytochrome [Variovorax sp. J31P216]MDM0024520.1 c-type cytochrome [Variovorax sp. J31P216]